ACPVGEERAMAMFDYAMILASIVIGLALTHLMQGLASLITGKAKVWWVHLLWVAYMMLTSVSWWWWEYTLRDLAVWTYAVYVFVLLYAFGIYLASALLFPGDVDGNSYEDCFLAHRQWFFALQLGLQFVDVVDSALKGPAHLKALGVEYFIATVAYVVLALVGIATPRRSVQAFIAVAWLMYQISWVARLFQTMQ